MGILTDIWNTVRPFYDPVADFDHRLPVRQRQTETTAATRTATGTTDTDGLHEGPDGKSYVRKQTTTDGGATVYELDSTDIRTGTNVSASFTKYDQYIFDKYRQEDQYKHFRRNLYELIKREAFSKSQDGKPISYREAAKLPAIRGKRGCGSRYLANYFKAMNEAFWMEQNKAPIEAKQGAPCKVV